MPEDDLRTKATQSIGWVIAERWGSRLLSLGVLVVLTRFLNPQQFGLVSLATAVIAVVQVFVDSGFSTALIQKRQLDPKDASTAFWTSVGLSVLLCVSVILLSPAISRWFGEPDLQPVLQVLSICLPIIALSRIPAGLLEREFDFRALSIRQLAGAAGGAVVAVPAVLMGLGVWALVVQTLAAAAVSVVTLWRSTSWRPRFEFSIDSLRSLWRTSLSVLGIELLDAVQGNIDKIIVGALFTTEQLGVYYLAQSVGTILIELVTSVISRVSLTTFSRIQDDLPRVNRIFRQLTFAASAISFPIFGLVALLAPQIVPTFFGPGWEASVPLMWILAPGWAVAALMYFDRGVLLATRHARTALSLALFQNVIGVLLVFALVPFGIVGVAISRLARILTWPVRLFILHRIIALRVRRYLLEALRCAAAVAPALAAIGLLQLTPWAHAHAAFWSFAVPLAVLGAATYMTTLWFIVGAENRAILRSILVEVRSKLRRHRSPVA